MGALVRAGEPMPTAEDMAPRILPVMWDRLPSMLMPDATTGLRWIRNPGAVTVVMSVEDRGDAGVWWHVSLGHAAMLPNWAAVVEVKETFMGSETTAMHMVPPRSAWINANPNVLHLWVRLDAETYPEGLYAP